MSWPVTMVTGQAPHITSECSADIKNRTPRACVSPTSRNLFQTYINDKIHQIHKPSECLQYNTKMIKGRGIVMAMLLRPPTKPINLS